MAMINRNLGNPERLLRLVLGLSVASWVAVQPQFFVLEWFLGIASIFLILNAITARCYLWKWLGLNTCGEGDDCSDGKPC